MKNILLLLTGVLALHFCSLSQHTCSRHNSSIKSFSATDSRSDSLDVLHTHIKISSLDFSSQSIDAEADILIRAKVDGIVEVDLDLLALTVTEITLNGLSLDYVHTNELIKITLNEVYNIDDEFELHVSYSGSPAIDESNWGGFYWNGSFAYNLGVGFDGAPHNFGRAWFPCFDNFVERCTFSFDITTTAPKIAIANGLPDYYGIEDSEGNMSNYWTIEKEIPSYLASMAVGEYEIQISQYYTTENDSIPIWLIAPESNLNNINSSFTNLPLAIEFYEEFYGDYEWSKVGYVFVPFNSGAMEHATNIAYPLSFADGSLTFETLMAHELAHHWWGNYVTCSTAEDMWINEGMASYSEALFTQQLYGPEAYYEWITDNHRRILIYAHSDDDGYLPVSGIGHENTYGTHVYSKGASVGHCLRNYMGDENFRNACGGFMNEYALQSVSSADMRDYFQLHTSENMTSFYDDWVYNPGFTDFSIDNQIITEINSSEYEIDLTISQRLHEAPNYFTNMPVTVSLISETDEEQVITVIISGPETTVTINSTFSPKHIILNRQYELTPAILAEEKTIGDTGIDNFSYAEFRSDIDELNEGDSLWIRVECHFTGPHEIQPQVEYEISTDRFWTIIGDFPEDMEASGRIRYYGNSSSTYDFDQEFFSEMNLLGLDEYEIVLLYRPNGNTAWTEHESYEIGIQGNENDFTGRIDFSNLRQGDYVWAFETGETMISEKKIDFRVFPNPVMNELKILNKSANMASYAIFDTSGKLLQRGSLENRTSIKCESIAPGSYALQIYSDENQILHLSNFIKY